ncbi:MAG: class I SAM-dependent methyltransferase [Saprospiraceae bacterium]
MKDMFSKQSAEYQLFRPIYPSSWYEAWMHLVQNRTMAWDCATGNGQTARDLLPFFPSIAATDISDQQLKKAFADPRIHYSVASAEHNDFPDKYFDLVTVSQAAHWFDLQAFYAELERTIRPGGLLAIWGYHLPRFGDQIDEVVNEFYEGTLGSSWDEARKHIDSYYSDLYFPYTDLKLPIFQMEMSFSLDQLIGYLSTWSALQTYRKTTGTDPLPQVAADLKAVWPNQEILIGKFPIFSKFALFPAK